MHRRAKKSNSAQGEAQDSPPAWSEPHSSGLSLRDATLQELQTRCKKGDKERPQEFDLRGIRLVGENLSGLDLSRYDLSGADLSRADLKDSDVDGANFELASLTGARLTNLKNYASARWIGVDIRDVDVRGAYLSRRHIMDENFLFEFRSRGPSAALLYWIWWDWPNLNPFS